MDEHSIKVEQLNIAQQILAQVFEQKSREEYATKDHGMLIRRRVLINVLVVFILGLSFLAIQQAVVTFSGDSNADSFELLVPSIVVSILNQIVPISFEVLARKEEWRTPLQAIIWTVVRSLILRIGSLYAFFYTYFVLRKNFMVKFSMFIGLVMCCENTHHPCLLILSLLFS